MEKVLDLHIHSKYSRACSAKLTLPNIEAACRTKGVDIIATGDFTHPAWFADIKKELEEIGSSGLYEIKGGDGRVKFILSTEVALIYKDGDRARRIHLVLHAPNIDAVEELNRYLGAKFNIKSDGRPILGMSAPELVRLCLSIHPRFLIYPAHLWTPWFSVFGSKSGFDSFEECFHEQTGNIYAYETGLSSDPEMNWRLSALDDLILVSNSDAHSLANIAGEANVFDLEKSSYEEIYNIFKERRKDKIISTLEFYPEEGMYHFDGHRECGVRLSPEETRRLKGVCPVCKKPLTIGVLNRVEELADRPAGFRPADAPGFKKLVELDKIIAEAMDIKSRSSSKVQAEYGRLIKRGGDELSILIKTPLEELKNFASAPILEGIRRVREGNLIIKPGFDGQYGSVEIFSSEEKGKNKQQKLL